MFITIEGVEGAGKSSVIADAAEFLREVGREMLITREPGGCALGKALRAQLLDSRNTGIAPETEIFLYLADRAQHVREVILPALALGKVVLCDRFTDSTLAYQGYGRGRDPDFLRALNEFATGGLKPDLTLLLDLPAEKGLARARERNALEGKAESEGRFEAEELVFHQRVREGFLAIAALEPRRFALVNVDRPLAEILPEVRGLLGRRINFTA